MKFPPYALATQYLFGLKGIEIGGSKHNSFGLDTIHVDYTDEITPFKQAEIALCGEFLPVDVVAEADSLPFGDSSYDFILNWHVFEHLPNPIKALREWHRVVRPGGFVFLGIPLRDAREEDAIRKITSYSHLIDDYIRGHTWETHPLDGTEGGPRGHYHVFTVHSVLDMIFRACEGSFEVLEAHGSENKVGNSFVIVLRVAK